MNPEQVRSSSFIVKVDDPGDHKHTRNNNRRNRSCEFRQPANKRKEKRKKKLINY